MKLHMPFGSSRLMLKLFWRSSSAIVGRSLLYKWSSGGRIEHEYMLAFRGSRPFRMEISIFVGDCDSLRRGRIEWVGKQGKVEVGGANDSLYL